MRPDLGYLDSYPFSRISVQLSIHFESKFSTFNNPAINRDDKGNKPVLRDGRPSRQERLNDLGRGRQHSDIG
jgi:hypothetical protein